MIDCGLLQKQEMEEFYTYIHGLEGNTPAFPQHYPRGVLLGCVHVANCLSVSSLALLAPAFLALAAHILYIYAYLSVCIR